jgi:hypothetical protein
MEIGTIMLRIADQVYACWMKDLPLYLLCASFGWPKKELVQINIRESGEPEGTALSNEIPLDKFREILIDKFKFRAEDVERWIGEMQMGQSYNCDLSMEEDGLHRSGLLTRYQQG